jgi:hypothetical protein
VGYEVTMSDGSTEQVSADAYRQEGQMLTFYRLEPGRRTIDCWARPVASFRTARLERVCLVEARHGAAARVPRLAS